MTSMSRTAILAAFSVLAIAKGAAPVYADGAPSLRVFAPAKGISLAVGPKRAIGYFTANKGNCDLVVTIADAYSDADAAQSKPLRVYSAVVAGSATRIETPEGQALQFACAEGAMTMSVQPIDVLAYAAPAK